VSNQEPKLKTKKSKEDQKLETELEDESAQDADTEENPEDQPEQQNPDLAKEALTDKDLNEAEEKPIQDELILDLALGIPSSLTMGYHVYDFWISEEEELMQNFSMNEQSEEDAQEQIQVSF
jgi:hypothetical protein